MSALCRWRSRPMWSSSRASWASRTCPPHPGRAVPLRQRTLHQAPAFHGAVMRAMDGLLTPGQFPLYALFLTVDASRVDVNIHPTKVEAKFQEERPIVAILQAAVKRALGRFHVAPSLDFDTESAFDIAPPTRPGGGGTAHPTQPGLQSLPFRFVLGWFCGRLRIGRRIPDGKGPVQGVPHRGDTLLRVFRCREDQRGRHGGERASSLGFSNPRRPRRRRRRTSGSISNARCSSCSVAGL